MSALERAPRGRLVDLGPRSSIGSMPPFSSSISTGVVLYANPYCGHLYGRTPEELLGDQSARFMIEPLSPELRSEIGARIMNGESWEGDFAVVRSDDRVVEVHAVNSPVFDESRRGHGRDQSRVRRHRRNGRSQEQLRQMLAIAQILRDVGQTLVVRARRGPRDADGHRRGAPAHGRDRRRVRRRDRDATSSMVAALSGRTATATIGKRCRPRRRRAARRRCAEPKPTGIDDLADGEHDAGLLDDDRRPPTGPLRSCVIAPVRSRSGAVVGGMLLAHTEPDRFTPIDAQMLGDIAEQAGIVLDIAGMFRGAEREIAAAAPGRGSAAVPRRDERALVVVTRLSRELRAARRAVRSVPRRSLPDRRRRRHGIRRRAAVHADPDQAELAHVLATRFAPDPYGPHPAASVVRGGKLGDGRGDDRRVPPGDARDPRSTTGSSRRSTSRRTCAFRCTARGRNLGALTLVSAGSGRRFDAADLALAEELAAPAGLALDNARLFAERDHVARRTAVELAAALAAVDPGRAAWRRATAPRVRATRSAATSTTCSRSAATRGRWCSAT